MAKIVVIVVICALSCANGLYIKEDQSTKTEEMEEKFVDILESWSNYKRKLKTAALSKDISDENENFNELEALEMIPSIIDHYKTGELSEDENETLSEIYGNMWQIIIQEAERNTDDEMNPLLKALFDSFQLTKGITNDVQRNTVRKIPKPAIKANQKLLLTVKRDDHPSQRLLKTAAMLIHQIMNSEDHKSESEDPVQSPQPKKMKHRKSSTRRATINLRLTNIPIHEITRTKRNVKIRLRGDELPSSGIEALLQIFKQKNGIDSLNGGDDDDDDEEKVEDEGEYDQKEDSLPHAFRRSSHNVLDYLYDDLYEDDEDVGAPAQLDPEYGSFQDLILLATKHRLRREQEETKLNDSNRHFLTARPN